MRDVTPINPGGTGGKTEDKTLKNVHVCSHCLMVHYYGGKMLACPYKVLSKTDAKKKAKVYMKEAYPEGSAPDM
eukprot:2500164-Ditylum_brightwellii.AAC.1